MLIAKPGLDGHDRGARLVASILRDAGHEVIYTGIRNTPAQIARAARDEDVDLVGLSVLAGGHLGLLERVVHELELLGVDIPVVIGGVIPNSDVALLVERGAAAVYPSSTPIAMIVPAIQNLLESRQGEATRDSHALY